MRLAAALVLLLALTGCTAAAAPADSVFDLTVGDCLNASADGGDASAADIVDCDDPHDFEVYASTLLPEGAYPGSSVVVASADDFCLGAFEGFVGIPRAQSRYAYATMYPTRDSWAGGDREVLCRIAAVDDDGDLVTTEGSLEGVKQ